MCVVLLLVDRDQPAFLRCKAHGDSRVVKMKHINLISVTEVEGYHDRKPPAYNKASSMSKY
jgi:hypothetical protein